MMSRKNEDLGKFRTSRLVLTSRANKTFSATLYARLGQLMWEEEEEEEKES
jgi:hypothetical protein